MPCLLRSLLIAECQTWTCGEHLNRFCFCFCFFFFFVFFFFFFHEQWSSRLRSKSKPFHWKWLYWWYSFAHVLYFETTGMLPEATVASGLLQTDLWYLNIYIYVFIYLCVLCMYIYIHRERESYMPVFVYPNIPQFIRMSPQIMGSDPLSMEPHFMDPPAKCIMAPSRRVSSHTLVGPKPWHRQRSSSKYH